jgi:hypothetical protein
MTYKDFTPAQAAAMRAELQKILRYLGPLKDRMKETGFPEHDPLYQKVWAANSAVFSLQFALQQIEHGHGWRLDNDQ